MYQQARRPRLLVPACMAAVAYVDPGNFAVNTGAGARHGYQLLFVVVAASMAAALIQYLAAKLGSATGQSLPEACVTQFGRPARFGMWLQAEIAVLMTEVAEVIGGAIAFRLLFGLPLVMGAVVISALSFAVLLTGRRGYSPMPWVVVGLLGVIFVALLLGLWSNPPPLDAVLRGTVPSPLDGSATLFAVGIIGATVMPHALHFHSAVARPVVRRGGSAGGIRDHARLHLRVHGRRRVAWMNTRSVALAMTLACAANVFLLVIAAELRTGGSHVLGLDQTFHALGGTQRLAGIAFGVALLASGLASSVVGAHTGQVVTDGFVPGRVPWWAKRVVTLAPPVALLLVGVSPDLAMVLSQVTLAFALPGTLVPLVWLTARRRIMHDAVNHRVTTLAAALVTTTIVGLDGLLLARSVPGLS